ncbi:MAG TPA: DUF2283 domain-containing protein [Rhizomicrobium sp.]|nr:DUF2283 domain-containing protein [Rhizomicrobium sp.]
MSDMVSFVVAYDKRADVLYISSRKAPAVRGITDNFGIVWRYDGTGSLIGATIMDFNGEWRYRHHELAEKIAEKFDIPTTQAEVVLQHAEE